MQRTTHTHWVMCSSVGLSSKKPGVIIIIVIIVRLSEQHRTQLALSAPDSTQIFRGALSAQERFRAFHLLRVHTRVRVYKSVDACVGLVNSGSFLSISCLHGVIDMNAHVPEARTHTVHLYSTQLSHVFTVYLSCVCKCVLVCVCMYALNVYTSVSVQACILLAIPMTYMCDNACSFYNCVHVCTSVCNYSI